jgi:thiol-disulfide isomerase/thioredoxin
LKTPILYFAIALVFVQCNTKKSISNTANNTVDKEVLSKTSKTELPIDSLETYVDLSAIKINFEKYASLSKVLEVAAAKNKLVYLDINATWCTPCKLMQRDVYSHKPTADFFNDNFVNHIVDIAKDEGPDLKIMYDIKVIPTLLWLDSRGRVIHRKEGAAYHAELIKNAETAISLRKP